MVCEAVTKVAVAPATSAGTTVRVDEVKIQNVRGVNAVLLREAIEAALRAANYPVDTEKTTVEGNEVWVFTLKQKSGDDVFVANSVQGTIETGGDKIAIRVYSQTSRILEGEEVWFRAPERVPEGVLKTLVVALKSE